MMAEDAQAQAATDNAESYDEYYEDQNGGEGDVGWASGFTEVLNEAADGGPFLETADPITNSQSFGLTTTGSSDLSGTAVSRSFGQDIQLTREFTFTVRFSSTGNLQKTGVSLNEIATSAQTFWDDGQRIFVGVEDGLWQVNDSTVTKDGSPYAAINGDVYEVSMRVDPANDLYEVTITNTENAAQGTSDEMAGLLEGSSALQSVSYSIVTDGLLGQEELVWDDMDLSDTQAPIPVELASFEGQLNGEAVVLSWQTASETNNARFEIERKTDDAWQRIGQMQGAGTTSEAQTYRFKDASVPFQDEAVSYRLKQVDLDGTSSYSPEVEVTLGAPQAFALHGNFPNPVRSQTTIRYELPQAAHVTISVYNPLGREVATLLDRQQKTGHQQVQFDASSLASGTYLYRVQAGDHTETRRMVVVE